MPYLVTSHAITSRDEKSHHLAGRCRARSTADTTCCFFDMPKGQTEPGAAGTSHTTNLVRLARTNGVRETKPSLPLHDVRAPGRQPCFDSRRCRRWCRGFLDLGFAGG